MFWQQGIIYTVILINSQSLLSVSEPNLWTAYDRNVGQFTVSRCLGETIEHNWQLIG